MSMRLPMHLRALPVQQIYLTSPILHTLASLAILTRADFLWRVFCLSPPPPPRFKNNCVCGYSIVSEMYLAPFDLSLFFLKNFKKEKYKFLQAIAPFSFDSLRSIVLLWTLNWEVWLYCRSLWSVEEYTISRIPRVPECLSIRPDLLPLTNVCIPLLEPKGGLRGRGSQLGRLERKPDTLYTLHVLWSLFMTCWPYTYGTQALQHSLAQCYTA
jgi:hypothetical protein